MENHPSGRSAGDIVAKIQKGNSENNVSETMAVRSANQSLLATKEGMSNEKAFIDYESKPNDRRKLFQAELGSSPLFPDLTPCDRPKAIGDMFYKTKLCCEFEVGNCLFMDKCNFAHGIEELRKRPIYGEELFDSSKQREIVQVQSSLFVDEDLTEEGCEYGKNCFSFRNEWAEDRKSEAICLLPSNESKSFTKDSNWKTRICYKWELSGWCPYGEKCHFAHGYAELRGYDGGLVHSGSGNSSAQPSMQDVGRPTSVIPHCWNRDQRLANEAQMAQEAPARRWKGPNKISKIYGDWIDDL